MLNPIIFWLLAGAGLMLLEAMSAPGIGLFLAGFGAITTAIILTLGLVEPHSFGAQAAWFFGATTVWTVLLWKPLQTFRVRQRLKTSAGGERPNIVGESGVVGKGGLQRGVTGQIRWSGTFMNAVLADAAGLDALPEGAPVTITNVTGTTVTVQPLTPKE